MCYLVFQGLFKSFLFINCFLDILEKFFRSYCPRTCSCFHLSFPSALALSHSHTCHVVFWASRKIVSFLDVFAELVVEEIVVDLLIPFCLDLRSPGDMRSDENDIKWNRSSTNSSVQSIKIIFMADWCLSILKWSEWDNRRLCAECGSCLAAKLYAVSYAQRKVRVRKFKTHTNFPSHDPYHVERTLSVVRNLGSHTL